MHLVTTDHVPGYRVVKVIGIVSGEVFQGANFVKDILASFTDALGGTSNAYASEMTKARRAAVERLEQAAREVGANAVIGIDLDFEIITRQKSSMMFVSSNGTAVRIEPDQRKVTEIALDDPEPAPPASGPRGTRIPGGLIHPSHYEPLE